MRQANFLLISVFFTSSLLAYVPVACAQTTQSVTTMSAPTQWDKELTTPGVQLVFERIDQVTQNGHAVVSYALRGKGFPRGKTYELWSKWLDGRIEWIGKFQINDETGLAEIELENGTIKIMPMSFQYQKMVRGEAIDYALISADQTVKAFTEIVPFPLEAKGEGGCSLSMRVGPSRRIFVISGEGFAPNEEIITLSKSENENVESKQKVSPQGKFAAVISPEVNGKTGGLASFRASGKTCEVILDYEWGTAMRVL